MTSNIPDPDPNDTIREHLYKRLQANVGTEKAYRQIQVFIQALPESLLDQAATASTVRVASYLIDRMTARVLELAGRGEDPPANPEHIDMGPFEGAETVGEIIKRYVSLHAAEQTHRLVSALEKSFPDVWDIEPDDQNRRRWVYTLQLCIPPEEIRQKSEAARLAQGLPSRNGDQERAH